MADHESNSLIDWSGPVVEYSSKPLIPLPSFDNPIDIAEDNPFDAVERQVNENELLDILNINLSFNNDSSGDEPVHVVPEEIIVECVDTVFNDEIGSNENCVDVSAESPKCENDALDNSFVGDLSDLSDFKEMILSRISCCMNQGFRSDDPAKSSSSSSENENASSIPTLNDSVILRSNELKDSDLLQSVGECEDLQSIKLNWDDYTMSSSDEENEKLVVEKPKMSNLVKKSITKPVSKIRDVRAPLVCQDPNIRIKKSNMSSKQGPMKAIVPVSGIKRIEDRKSTQTSTNVRVTAPSKLRVTPTNQSKLKKWTSPIASSTPQNSNTSSPSFIRRSLISNPSPASSIQKQNQTYSHPPSPDSTTDLKMLSRSVSASRVTPKNYAKNVSSNLVSSSTKDSSKSLLKTSKDVGIRSLVRNVRNKENVKPFRY